MSPVNLTPSRVPAMPLHFGSKTADRRGQPTEPGDLHFNHDELGVMPYMQGERDFGDLGAVLYRVIRTKVAPWLGKLRLGRPKAMPEPQAVRLYKNLDPRTKVSGKGGTDRVHFRVMNFFRAQAIEALVKQNPALLKQQPELLTGILETLKNFVPQSLDSLVDHWEEIRPDLSVESLIAQPNTVLPVFMRAGQLAKEDASVNELLDRFCQEVLGLPAPPLVICT